MELYEKIIYFLVSGFVSSLVVLIFFSIKRFLKRSDKKFDILFTKNSEQNKDINAIELTVEKLDGKIHTTNEKVKGIDKRVGELIIKTA